VKLHLRVASEELPAELATLIEADTLARRRGKKLTPAQQRMLREEILAARQSSTRAPAARRARWEWPAKPA